MMLTSKTGKPGRPALHILLAGIPLVLALLTACGQTSPGASGPQVSVHALDADPMTDVESLIHARPNDAFHTGSPSPFLNLTVLKPSGWFAVTIRFADRQEPCTLDTGPVPTGLRVLAVPNPSIPGGWHVLRDDEIPVRFLGFLQPSLAASGTGGRDGIVTVLMHIDSPMPYKALLSCISEKGVEEKRIEEGLFRAIFLTLMCLFLIHFVFFYFYTRDSLHLHFAGYFISYIGYFLFFSGTIHVLPVRLPEYAVLYVSVSLALIFLNRAVLRLFHLRQRSRWFHRALNGMALIFALQLMLFPLSQRILIFAFFITSEINTSLLIAATALVIVRARPLERLVALLFLITQLLAFHAGLYFTGAMDIFLPALASSPSLYDYMHFSGMIVILGLFGTLLLGSLSARFSSAYNQMQIVEDDGKILPREVGQSRERMAANGSGAGSALSEREIQEWGEKLHHLMSMEKIYQDPEMDLNRLAASMGVQPWRLSVFLNGQLGQSFWDLLTSYRVNEVARRLREEDRSITVLRIAYEAGFDSKSAFNRAFRKVMGVTPSEYRNRPPTGD